MPTDATTLRAAFQQLIRESGTLDTSQTPCGVQVSPTRAHALMYLLGQEQLGIVPRQSDLQFALRIDKSNVSRLVRQMVSAGDVHETVCPVDGRARRVSLTGSGRRRAQRLDTRSLERFEELYGALDLAQRKKVTIALVLLTEALQTLNAGAEVS